MDYTKWWKEYLLENRLNFAFKLDEYSNELENVEMLSINSFTKMLKYINKEVTYFTIQLKFKNQVYDFKRSWATNNKQNTKGHWTVSEAQPSSDEPINDLFLTDFLVQHFVSIKYPEKHDEFYAFIEAFGCGCDYIKNRYEQFHSQKDDY